MKRPFRVPLFCVLWPNTKPPIKQVALYFLKLFCFMPVKMVFLTARVTVLSPNTNCGGV